MASVNFKTLGVILIAIGVIIAGSVLYHNSQKRRQSIVFSPKLMLAALWNAYKTDYLEPGTGRTLDKQRDNITTSEGQSYTMLRAVWQDDKETFDKSWQWTKSNLQRPDDHLFSWLYGKKPDDSYGILDAQGGENSASDADTDIAVALLFASSRWGDASYAQEAKEIITDIWNQEVAIVNNVHYLTAGNMEQNSSGSILINPSYLAPYAYRLFAQVDPEHNWDALVGSSYKILEEASLSALDKPSSSNLPPDWIMLDRKTGKISAPSGNGLTTNFGFDAMRVPFRLAMDWQWNKDARAKTQLEKFKFLGQEWNGQKAIYTTYTHDGQKTSSWETPAMYGGTIGYFMAAEPGQAKGVYQNKLQNLYSPDYQDWKKPMGYYDDNWTWFGLALYNGNLINLFSP